MKISQIKLNMFLFHTELRIFRGDLRVLYLFTTVHRNCVSILVRVRKFYPTPVSFICFRLFQLSLQPLMLFVTLAVPSLTAGVRKSSSCNSILFRPSAYQCRVCSPSGTDRYEFPLRTLSICPGSNYIIAPE